MDFERSRQDLPIFQYKTDLINAINQYQILVVVGDTGSGKTTQLPQYMMEDKTNTIAVTQPRRIAAISAANRVAEEAGSKLGDLVGYSVRFERCISKYTKLTYMTDGTLLQTCTSDPEFKQYSVIILDESHERSLETDILFGLLRKACRNRPELKVIIMSATLDIEKFTEYFDCPAFSVPGRMFEVDVFWQRKMKFSILKSTYVERSVSTVMHIHKNENLGDVLVFLTGQFEIEQAVKQLEELEEELNYSDVKDKDIKGMVVYPIYSSLETLEQKNIFKPARNGYRKVVIATNIAQTSVTVPGIKYVVDCGFVKQKQYDAKTHMDALLVVPVSQAAATQRAGRAGRTESGKVYRLYCKEAFEEMAPTTTPEIQRSSLLGTILYLLKIGIKDVLNFDFIDPPEPSLVMSAIKELFLLGAVNEHGALTHMGKMMADFPISPYLSRCLISSAKDFKCSEEVVTIAAMLSSEDFFLTPRNKDKVEKAEEIWKTFFDSSGDHVTYWNCFNAWERSNFSKDWCVKHFFHFRALNVAKNVKQQLQTIMRKHHLPLVSIYNHKSSKLQSSARVPILKAFCTGFYTNTAKKHQYRPVFFPYLKSVSNTANSSDIVALYLSSSSSLSQVDPDRLEWIIYNDVQYVNRANMKVVSRIDFSMVEVHLGRVDLMDTSKLCKIDETNTHDTNVSIDEPKELDESNKNIPIAFDSSHEIIDELHHKEHVAGETVKPEPLKEDKPDSAELKRIAARERFLARKKLKK
ncbi:P-loop containing nucleoside triphosphate hydrolase protein [Globomyces pollinis-pini]|nr:P-loop containing nucleoside triphosphate hydrolase protein [Globomyces pollinis-pini]